MFLVQFQSGKHKDAYDDPRAWNDFISFAYTIWYINWMNQCKHEDAFQIDILILSLEYIKEYSTTLSLIKDISKLVLLNIILKRY